MLACPINAGIVTKSMPASRDNLDETATT